MRALLVAAVALLLSAPASAAPERRVAASGAVGALAVSAHEVAYASAAGPRCTEVRVWDTADRGVRRYARPCFVATSTGSGVAGAAVAGRRALWLTYTGGNTREWSLWTSTRAAPRPRLLRFAARDVDATPPLVLGTAHESALVYALDRLVVSLRPTGARRFAWEAPERVVALTARQNGYAVLLAGGDVVTLDPGGAPVRRHAFAPGEARAAALAPGTLVVQLGDRLLVRGLTDRTLPLPAGARFLGLANGVVAYGSGGELRLLRLSDGRDVVLRRLPAGFHAALDRRGLAYGSGSTVSFVGWTGLAAALG